MINEPAGLVATREKSFKCRLGGLVTGGVFIISGTPVSRAESSGLPLPLTDTGSATAIGELTSPALHPNIDVGHASASYSADGHKLTINQNTDKAVLDWQSFNIDAGNSVQFVQPGSSSVALNNIYQVDASRILGNLSANGQVYLVNSNGFVFGKNASVNTNSLVATTLKIADEVFDKGITNVVDSAGGSEPVAAFAGDGTVYRDTGNGKPEKIKILVEKGASITAANSGRVILAAPEIENDGTITAPDGQVILAAATDKVYLQASESSDLRGLLVEVGTGGEVKNVGKILTERGNTTMMGFAVSQQGIASANTSTTLNGSVRLLAREGAKLEQGDNGVYRLKPVTTKRAVAKNDGLGTQAEVVMESGSLTMVALDASGGTAVNEQLQPKSRIDVEAGLIRMKDGSQIVAPSGTVNMNASAAPDYAVTKDAAGNKHYTSLLSTTTQDNPSRIVLETGSNIDVSGVKNLELAMPANIVDVELLNNELRDAPIQKTGILHGQKVYVDMRKGTTLADASGAIAKLQHSVYERNTAAGSVNLHSEGDVIVRQGAAIDISGGTIHFLGGDVQTTKLLSNGIFYDIASADPNRTYQQIINGHYYQAGYAQGSDAGAVDIKSRGLVLNGNILADIVNGPYQRTAADLAKGGELTIDTSWSGLHAQNVWFQAAQTFTAIGLNEAVPAALYLSNDLFSHGLNRFNLATLGKMTIAQDATLKLPAGGQLSLQAGEIEVLGNISAAAGNVTLKTEQNGLDGHLHLASGSVIDTGGSWVNDLKDSRDRQALQSLTINAGKISLAAQGDLLLDSGSRLNANGGAWLKSSGKVSAGKGGDISLANSSIGSSASIFQLDAALSSFALESGGALNITASGIAVSDALSNRFDNGALYLSKAVLQSGGFDGYRLISTDGELSVAAGTQIGLQQSNWQLNAGASAAASGADLSSLVHLVVLPDYLRHAVGLSLNYDKKTAYSSTSGIRIGDGATIAADPTAALTLASVANIVIDGTLSAPAGQISLSLTAPSGTFDGGYDPNIAIVLGDHGHLNAAGAAVLTPNSSGLIQGEVRGGGLVEISATRGYILTDSHSSIDVSGSNAALDIVNSRGRSRQNVASNAGSISLTAAEGMVLQGQILAKAGAGNTAAGSSSSAAGGSLILTLNAQNRSEGLFTNFPTGSRGIHLSVDPQTPLTASQIAAVAVPQALNGQAYIAAKQIQDGGFDNLSLSSAVIQPSAYSASPIMPERGAISFDGDVSLSLRQNLTLDAPLISHHWLGTNDSGLVSLTANTASLGSSWNRAVHGNLADPASAVDHGQAAIFKVAANNIDLQGSSEVSGFAKTQLNSSGDIRMIGVDPGGEADLVGSLALTGRLSLSAREIFPTTYSQFSVTIDTGLSPDGLIEILPATAAWATPLSAGGQLTLAAAHIASQGNLLAPFGSISLNASKSLNLADGSFTSVSDDNGIVIPFGRTQGGLSWAYPLGIYSNIQVGTPQKAINLVSPNIALADGAKVNLNGGGDLSAFEFISGPGGSLDVLDTSGSYAIVPSYQAKYAAYDALEFAKSGLILGDSIHLSADSGLPAGDYVLLPAHYALMAGAYLVTPQSDRTDMEAGTTATRADGATIVAGYRYTAGTQISDSRWSGFAVESGNVARTRSEYQETTASAFFNGKGALPQDAGNLSLLAEQNLMMAAEVSAKAASGGLGGMLDIAANQLAVVNRRGDSVAAGTVALVADELNRLGVDSILIGGRRSRGTDSTRLTVSAENVSVAAGAQLQGPEILMAASGGIVVAQGAAISAIGSVAKSDTKLDIVNAGNASSDGALLRVSNAAQAIISRDTTQLSRQNGVLNISENVVLSASGSILLDASKDSRFLGGIAMDSGELTLSSSLITLGGSGSAQGLQLSESALNRLHADKLTLNSYGSVDIADALNLQLKTLVIDAAGIYGFGAAGQTGTIQANGITLKNSGSSSDMASASGQGILNLKADIITLANTWTDGSFAFRGFSQVQFNAQTKLLNSGSGRFNADSNVGIATPLWTAVSGADTTLNLGNYTLTTVAKGNAASSNELGARLNVNARNIDHQGHIELASGVVKLDAVQDLSVSGSVDTSGRIVDLAGNQAYSGSGSISLSAENGDLDVLAGALLNVSGSFAGGDAGTLSISAGHGRLALSGTIAGHGYQGAKGGNLSLDAASYASGFSNLNRVRQSGGFRGDLVFRQRLGDLTVAAGDKVKTSNLTMTADSGKLDVYGGLNVGGDQAGSLRLSAGDSLVIHAPARLGATSTGSGNSGGKVVLSSLDADGDSLQGVTIEAGAELDVSGGASGKGGSVDVVVKRLGTVDAAVNIAAGTLIGAASEKVTAVMQYLDATLSNAHIQQWRNETQGYIDAAASNGDLTHRLGGFGLQPGLDVASSDNLTLDLSESLRGAAWTKVSSQVWTTQLTDVAGVVGKLQQIAGGGSKTLTEATSSVLTTDGSYYFDANPNSATFRTLFVRIFPNTGVSAANKYNPGQIAGSLIEHNGWDLAFPGADGSSWRFGNDHTPGVLNLRAAGDLNINQSLSDGFALYDKDQLGQLLGYAPGTAPNWLRTWVLQTGESWGFNLVAGADLSSANPLDVKTSTAAGSLTIGSNTSVCTGTGDIYVAAAGDIRLTDWTSTLYTAGHAAENERWGSLNNNLVAGAFFVDYPFGGGDLSLSAGGNIIGASTPQFLADWLQRTGNWNPANGITSADRPTAWGIAYDGLVTANSANSKIQNLKFGFRENIGALGGGNVSVHAGADIRDLSVMLPASAKPVGRADGTGLITENFWQLQSGGKLDVAAGGDIAGGVFYLEQGLANITAQGAITGGAQYSAGPILAMGDARFNVAANQGIAVGAVLNPFTLPEPKFLDKVDYFATYTANSGLDLQTLAGDIRINNDTALIKQQAKLFTTTNPNGGNYVVGANIDALLTLYPGNLSATALTGGMRIENNILLYPAAGSSLDLLAAGDIEMANGVVVNQLDVDPALWLSPKKPTTVLSDAIRYLLYTSPPNGDSSVVHAAQPVHLADTSRNRVVSANGSIVGIGDALLVLAKASDITAGLDIANLGLRIQNLHAGDVTTIEAGRDIVYPLQRDPATGVVDASAGGIQLAGPGLLNVWAVRDIDLGTSEGIATIGSLYNPALDSRGADITVLAGNRLAKETGPLEDFLNKYVVNGAYSDELAALNQQTTNSGRQQIALRILFREIRQVAELAAATGDASKKASYYQRGYDAIARLFPDNPAGDIKLFFSQIQTLAGGNIDLLAPGGMLNAGLASAFTGSKNEAELGIIVQRQGDINILTRGDVQVNQSRIFTLDGGDIAIWSSDGDIDAGRGAKSALAAPQPTVSIDANGNIKVDFPATVSGKGIRAQSGYNSARIGNVFLVAPHGVVVTGEAGIGGSAPVIPGTIIGNNIDSSSPPPPAATPIADPASQGNAATAAVSKTAGGPDLKDDEGSSTERGKKAAKVASLDTQLLGFGSCSVAEIQQGCGSK